MAQPLMAALRDLPQRVDRLSGFDALLSAFQRSDEGPTDERVHGQIIGLAGAARSLVLARLFQRRPGQLLIITYQAEQIQRILDDLRHFGIPDDQLYVLPASEGRWLANEVTDYRALGERISALSAMAESAPCIVIATPEAVFQRTGPPSDLTEATLTLRAGEAVRLDELLGALTEMGYETETTVSRPGQFSRRGGILDIFASTSEAPVRLELFGDEVESLRTFDVATQRSTATVPQVRIAPMREVRLTQDRIRKAAQGILDMLQRRKMELAAAKNRPAFDSLTEHIEDDLTRLENGVYFDGLENYLPFLVGEPLCALDYLRSVHLPEAAPGANSSAGERLTPLVLLDEPAQVRAHWERRAKETADARERRYERGELLEGAEHHGACADGIERIARALNSVTLTQLERTVEGFPAGPRLAVSAAQMESYRARLGVFADEVRTWLANGADCLVVSDQPHRVREICTELKLPVGEVLLAGGPDHRNGTGSSEYVDGSPVQARGPSSLVPHSSSLAVLDGRLRQGFKFADIGLFVATDAELFGSTRPVFARRRATSGVPISTILDLRENDYVVHIHHGIGIYRGLVKRTVETSERDYLHVQYTDGSLYVPADQIDRVQRYIGGEGAPPAVNRIGGNEWARTTRRVKEQARDMAKELIELYAARHASERPSLGEDSPWQTEMEEAFPYDETPSQLRAIEDVKADLEQTRPMDRLICGDVGFGKTEVAIRAAFKVVEAGKQVAVLCPTTVLAAQHHTTFSERLAAYPMRIELLSRFRSRQEQKATVERLKTGEVEIVIGTHRLLSKDVEFEKLGLIIVDEEQRFGVAHKERLKQIRKSVDVLTLTATPIPRTLSMALSGLRDMSVIEDPPSGRVPIATYVREYDDDVIRDALLRELERDGQVYVVHNRIESIAHVAQRVQRLAPDARVAVGHGQMSEEDLERLMFDFYHGEYDVLVCTTIIENGLDVPNVNTIIVDNADRMGLAQLYQLRGRVGRSDRQAYAYLLYRPHKQLSEDAERRLVAIREFTALGSGFQIAMRDLEIRGAGNLLGAEQSGAIVSVGYDLYCQLLAQAVAEARGEEPAEDILPPVDLPVTAHIPGEYIPNEAERIFFYKRMSNVRSQSDVEGLQEELHDRYGDPPRPVWTALAVLRLRLRARAAGIASIRGERTEVSIRFRPDARLSAETIRIMTGLYKKHRFTSESVTFALTSAKIMDEVENLVDILERAPRETRKPTSPAIGARV